MMKKKIMAMLLAIAMIISMTACSSKEADPAKKYNLNYESEEIQQMSEEKVDTETLNRIGNEWLSGATMFIRGMHPQADYTYEDFVKEIGVDATEYNLYIYDNKYSSEGPKNLRQYTWISSDDETKKLGAFFEELNGKWVLWGVGYVNLNVSMGGN